MWDLGKIDVRVTKVGPDAYTADVPCPACGRTKLRLFGSEPEHRSFVCGCGAIFDVVSIVEDAPVSRAT